MELSERLDGLQAEAYSPAWVILWAIGALSLAVLFMVSYLRCNREFQMSLPVENNFTAQWLQEHRRLRTVQIRQSERIDAPLTYGIFRPVILMPKNTDWENGRQLQYVLAHELVHIRRFDGALKLIMALALCIHWFNPLVWIMYMLFNRDIELVCDESVIRLFGENARSAYAFTLSQYGGKEKRDLALNFSRNAIEERIVSIMKTKRVTVGAVFAGILIIVGMAAVFTTSVKKDNAWRRTISRKLLRNRSCKKRIILRKAGSSCRKVEGDCGCSGKAWSEFYSADETVKALKTDGNG